MLTKMRAFLVCATLLITVIPTTTLGATPTKVFQKKLQEVLRSDADNRELIVLGIPRQGAGVGTVLLVLNPLEPKFNGIFKRIDAEIYADGQKILPDNPILTKDRGATVIPGATSLTFTTKEAVAFMAEAIGPNLYALLDGKLKAVFDSKCSVKVTLGEFYFRYLTLQRAKEIEASLLKEDPKLRQDLQDDLVLICDSDLVLTSLGFTIEFDDKMDFSAKVQLTKALEGLAKDTSISVTSDATSNGSITLEVKRPSVVARRFKGLGQITGSTTTNKYKWAKIAHRVVNKFPEPPDWLVRKSLCLN